MSPELSTAFTLFGIGMITVFVVLLLVVLTGNFMIRLVNRMTTEPTGELSEKTIAVITSAVDAFTAGKGRITKIEKE